MTKTHPLILLPALPPLALAVAMESTTEHFCSPPTPGETLLPASSLSVFPFQVQILPVFPVQHRCERPQTFPAWFSVSASFPAGWNSPDLPVPPPQPASAIPPVPAPSASPARADTHSLPPHPTSRRAAPRPLCLPPCLSLGQRTVNPWQRCHPGTNVAPVPALWGGKGSSQSAVVREAQAVCKCVFIGASAHTHPGSREDAGARRLPLAPGSFCSLPAPGCASAKPRWAFQRVIFKPSDLGMRLAARLRGASAI